MHSDVSRQEEDIEEDGFYEGKKRGCVVFYKYR